MVVEEVAGVGEGCFESVAVFRVELEVAAPPAGVVPSEPYELGPLRDR